jgi:hypothetical protein
LELSGSFSTHHGPMDSRVIFKIPADLATDGKMTIAVRELNLHEYLPTPGFAPAVASFDQAAGVMDEDTLAYLRTNWQHYLCFTLLGCTGLFFFVLFSVNTKLREYFWLGALLGLSFLFRLGELASVVDFGLPSWTGTLTYNLGNGVQTLIVIEFVFSFLGRPVPWFFRLEEPTLADLRASDDSGYSRLPTSIEQIQDVRLSTKDALAAVWESAAHLRIEYKVSAWRISRLELVRLLLAMCETAVRVYDAAKQLSGRPPFAY